jgi:hypothetical protein
MHIADDYRRFRIEAGAELIGNAVTADIPETEPNEHSDVRDEDYLRPLRCRLTFHDPTKGGIPRMHFRYPCLSALVLAAASLLNLPAIADQATSLPLQMAQAGNEFDFWNSIKDSKKAEDYQAYLDKYPNGDFADLAKLRMKKYAAAPASMPAPAKEAEPAASDPAPAQGMTFEAKDATIYARDGGQVRAGPDPKAALVIKLNTNTEVQATALSSDGRWWRVEVAGGQMGYMHHSVVSDRPEPATEPTMPLPETEPTMPLPTTTQPTTPLPTTTRPATPLPATPLPATTQPASN